MASRTRCVGVGPALGFFAVPAAVVAVCAALRSPAAARTSFVASTSSGAASSSKLLECAPMPRPRAAECPPVTQGRVCTTEAEACGSGAALRTRLKYLPLAGHPGPEPPRNVRTATTPFFGPVGVPERDSGGERASLLFGAATAATRRRGGPSFLVDLCSLIAARGGDGVRGGGRPSWLAMCGEPCTAARCVDPAALGFPSYSCPSGPTRGMLLPAEARNDAGCWGKLRLASALQAASKLFWDTSTLSRQPLRVLHF